MKIINYKKINMLILVLMTLDFIAAVLIALIKNREGDSERILWAAVIFASIAFILVICFILSFVFDVKNRYLRTLKNELYGFYLIKNVCKMINNKNLRTEVSTAVIKYLSWKDKSFLYEFSIKMKLESSFYKNSLGYVSVLGIVSSVFLSLDLNVFAISTVLLTFVYFIVQMSNVDKTDSVNRVLEIYKETKFSDLPNYSTANYYSYLKKKNQKYFGDRNENVSLIDLIKFVEAQK